MAFTGVPVVKRVSDSLVRITGISLAANAVGTISLFEGAGEVKTPDDFEPTVYAGQGPGGAVTLQDSIELSHLPGVPIQVVKSGTTKQNWLATLTNLHTTNGGDARSAMFYNTTSQSPITVLDGAAVPFPSAGPQVGGGIVPGGVNQFVLPDAGVYRVSWSAAWQSQSELQVALDGVGIPNTVALAGDVGAAATVGDQINNTVLVSATAGQLLSIINPVGNATLTAQGANEPLEHEQALSLVIERVLLAESVATGALEIYVRHH